MGELNPHKSFFFAEASTADVEIADIDAKGKMYEKGHGCSGNKCIKTCKLQIES